MHDCFYKRQTNEPINSCKVQLRHFLMLTQQTKGQLVMGANVHWCWQLSHTLTSQGKGPRFSSFQFLSPCSLHTFFLFYPFETFSHTVCVISKSRLRCQTKKSCSSDTCYWTCTQSQHQDACYILCCTSFFYSIGWGASSRARRTR